MDYTTVHDQDVCRFEVVEPSEIAYLQYEVKDGVLDILHIYVPSDLEGNGIASLSVNEAMKYGVKKRLLIRPTCPFAKAFFTKHVELKNYLSI